jgi:hypothetical protein
MFMSDELTVLYYLLGVGSGVYYVAEVTSRLVDKPGFIALICSFGFELVEHVSSPLPPLNFPSH